MTTRLSLLGPLELTAADGRSIQSVLAQPRRLALLAYLAAASPRRFHSRDHLLVLFWPEADESSARNTLRQALHYLRRSLGEAVVQSRGEELGIDPDHLACDVALFDAAVNAGELEQALALYRGDLLEGFHIADAPDFERWVEEQRIRLRRCAVDAAWALVDDAEARGDGTATLTCARRAHALAPDEEVSLRRLLALLDRSGERADALREYHAFAHRIAAAYELEPSPETCALISGIRSRVAAEDTPGLPVAADSIRMSEPEQQIQLPGVRNETADAAAPIGSSVRTAEAKSDNTATHVIPTSTARRPRGWGWAAGIVLLIAATFTVASVHDRSPLEQGRVLVASFENRTGDPALDPVGDMAADWIAQGLQQTGLVEVIDPASSLLMSREAIGDGGLMAGPLSTAALANVSGAGTVISGAFYQQGDSIVFRTRITDAKTGVTLHALEPVSAPSAEPISSVEVLRSRVAGVLATMLDSRMSSLSPPTSRPPTYEAYREYITGLELFVSQRSVESIPRFAAAARLDTMFALPLVWSVFAYGNNGYRSERDSIVRILEARRHRLDPLDLHALDYFEARDTGDKAAALASARKAAQLAPGSHWSHNAAYMARDLNRLKEAGQHWQRIDPEHGWAKSWKSYWDGLTGVHHMLGQHDEELEVAVRGRRLGPDFIANYYYVIRALVAMGRIEEATKQLEESLRLSPLRNAAAGELLHVTALEMREHGHSEAAAQHLQLAIDWFRSPALEEWLRDRDRAQVHRARLLGMLGSTLYEAGRYDEAYLHLEAISREYPGQFDHSLGLVAARRGNRLEAERVIALLESRKDDARSAADTAMRQARIAALLGDRTRTLGYLREAIRGGYSVDLLHTMSEFDSVSGDSTFRALVQVRG